MSKKYFVLLILTLFLAMSVVSAEENLTSDIHLQADNNDNILEVNEDFDDVVEIAVKTDNLDESDYGDKLKSSVEVSNLKSSEITKKVQKTEIKDNSKYSATIKPKTVTSVSHVGEVVAPKITTVYTHSKVFQAKVIDKNTKKPLSNVNVLFNIASKNYVYKTNSNGLIQFKIPFLQVGTYPVVIKSNSASVKLSAKSSIQIVKLKTKIKAYPVTATYKQSKWFKFKITDADTGRQIKKVTVAFWIDGKKTMAKLDNNGWVGFNTKYFKVGTHKLHLKTYSHNVVINYKTTFKIKQVAKKTTSSSGTASSSGSYIGNTNTYKFHYASCSAVKRMNSANKISLTRQQAINWGYSPCGICNP